MRTKMVLALLILVSTAFLAAAQTQVSNTLNITTAFPFYVGSTVLPKGSYVIKASGAEDTLITITSTDGKNKYEVEASTRISATPEDKDSVVFDVAGNDHYLSEVYIQGGDGYLIPGSTVKHTHARIKAKK
jgi:hypothetical protein